MIKEHQVFTQGIIYGERFNCRGSSCSEKKLENFYETNILSTICISIVERRRIMEVGMYRSWSNDVYMNEKPDELNIGQLNYFFRVTILVDEILANVPFASVVTRNYADEYSLLYEVDVINKKENFDPTICFTAATNIVATVFAVGFLDDVGKACVIASGRHTHQSVKVMEEYSTSNIPVKLKLIPMNLNRDKVIYRRDNNYIYNSFNLN